MLSAMLTHTGSYLLEVHELDQEEMALGSEAISWPANILPVFDDNAILLERVKARGEETLVAKKEKVLLEIEKVLTDRSPQTHV